MYDHFLLLSCAIRILTSPNLCIRLNNCAQNLLEHFINQFSEIYDDQYVTHNVHNLSHLCNDVKRFGSLDNFSAFPPESFMYHLKHQICLKSGKPLQQVVKRLAEATTTFVKHDNNHCIITKKNFNEIQMNGFIWSDKRPDNFCLLRTGQYIAVSEIFERNHSVLIKGKVLKSIGNFFEEPIDSIMLGINSCIFDDMEVSSKITEVISKVMCLPYKEYWVVLPLVHSGESNT